MQLVEKMTKLFSVVGRKLKKLGNEYQIFDKETSEG